jgi:hypothetical protein
VRRAVLARIGFPVPAKAREVLPGSRTTWESLVEIGLIFVDNGLIAVPPFAQRVLGSLAARFPDAFRRCRSWELFEKLLALAELVRLRQLIGTGRSLQQLLPGVPLPGEVAQLDIGALEREPRHELLRHQFPRKTARDALADADMEATVFVNARSAPFSDVFYFLRATDGRVVLVALQCKHTEAGQTRLTSDEAAEDLDKVRGRLAERNARAFLRDKSILPQVVVHVLVTNRAVDAGVAEGVVEGGEGYRMCQAVARSDNLEFFQAPFLREDVDAAVVSVAEMNVLFPVHEA